MAVPNSCSFVEGSPDPYMFPIHVVATAVSANQQYVKCRGINDVALAALAPDISLSEFKGAKVLYNDVQVIKQIGEGGFAKVYKVLAFLFLLSDSY